YLRPAMRPWVLGAGAVLLVLGLGGLMMGRRRTEHPHAEGRVTWLLLLPVLALVLIRPAPLGAFAASRQAAVPPAAPTSDFRPLVVPSGGAPVSLSMRAFVSRALYDRRR